MLKKVHKDKMNITKAATGISGSSCRCCPAWDL